MFRKLSFFCALALATIATRAQEAPPEISPCELANNPKSLDGKTICVRASLNVEFEDFTLALPHCGTDQGIWLAFGGDVPGIVTSMVNDNVRTPGKDIQVNGVSYSIKKDEDFRRLYALISFRTANDKPLYHVTAKLTGTFFAGEERKVPNGKTEYLGYGHLGCCSLFIITAVSQVESVPQADLRVRGTLTGPDGKPFAGFTVINDIVGGSPPERQTAITDEKGAFAFAISGQLLRFENPQYRPLAISVKPGSPPVHARLEDAKRSDWLPPSCSQSASDAARIGFSVLFALPPTMDSKLENFDDDGSHTYFVFPRGADPVRAQFFISHDSQEQFETDRFIDSPSSEQRWIKDASGTVIGIDARGHAHDGYWRVATFFAHDVISYDRAPASRKRTLDTIVDSACIPKPR